MTAHDLNAIAARWSPAPVHREQVVAASVARDLAATLDLELDVVEGDPLPLLWHWTHFLDWVPTRELGADGHPRDGHFLPPLPHRRRMFAGGRVRVMSPLTVGQKASRTSTLANVSVKRGRTGDLLFVTLRHDYRQGGESRLVEEQDLVYRSEAGVPASVPPPVVRPLGEQTAPWAATPTLHPALLFRFSALTGNAHRIHYDQAYASEVEGFPALVVHGPLLAIQLCELARSHGGGIEVFEFRLKRPVFVTDRIRVQGTPAADGRSARLEIVTGDGDVHATASASFTRQADGMTS